MTQEVLKLALEALDKYGFAPCDKEEDWQGFKRAITAIKEALAQPEQPVDCERCNRLEDALKRANGLAEHFERAWYLRGDEIERLTAQPEQEPMALQMDVIVVNLVREGINKHRARELAEHFIKHTTPPQRTDKERILQLIKELRPAIKPLEGMGRGKTTNEWFDILVQDIEEKL